MQTVCSKLEVSVGNTSFVFFSKLNTPSTTDSRALETFIAESAYPSPA
jgi:hypothetical protein